MPIQAVPAFVTLLFKLGFLLYALRAPQRDGGARVFIAVLAVLSLHNLVEFLLLIHFSVAGVDATTTAYGSAYFATVILSVALIVHLSLRFSIDDWSRLQSVVVPLLYLPVVVLEYLLLYTKTLVAGFQPFQGYTVLRVPGPLYFLFEAYSLVYALAGLAYVIYGARSSRPSTIKRIRNRWWLFGLSPLVLLHLYFIVANHFGLAKISSTIFIPIAMTFFLLVTTYATHQYRLFDIEFFWPWSKVRKRKTVFYQRIQAMVAEIAELKSINEILDTLAEGIRCQVALIGGPRPLAAFVEGQQVRGKDTLLLADFPRDALGKIDRIVVAHEITDSRPELYRLMMRHKVGAIVPFHSHSAASANWMLFGEHFSDQVYTPLDFKVVERLFDRIAERFLDDFMLLRSQLADAKEELGEYKRRLGVAWSEVEDLNKKLEEMEARNGALRAEKAELRRRSFKVVDGGGIPEKILSGEQTLEEHVAEFERGLIVAALRKYRGDRKAVAEELGVRLRTLHYLMQRHELDFKKFI